MLYPNGIDRRTFIAGASAAALSGILPRMGEAADALEPIYDEAKVPPYTLPDPLTLADGTKVADAGVWQARRRDELLSLFADHVYGRTPTSNGVVIANTGVAVQDGALAGLAKRSQTTLTFTRGDKSVAVDVLVYSPMAASGPVPAFLGLNFFGNHTVADDPAIKLPASWLANNAALGISENRATDASRGVRAHRWPIRTILQRGYALATAYCGDIDPDFDDGFANGVHPLLDTFNGARPDHAWGSIGAWAWGLSRILDHLAAHPQIDTQRVAVIGHSRLGKAALWAGAQDERFAMTISNNSGCGGAALNRRRFGESVARITASFPHWFCRRYAGYADNEGAMPVDTHELIALCAPRPVYVASAEGDRWADPHGEFLACLHASPVYELLGGRGVGADAMPAVDDPLMTGSIAYHVRKGKHDLTEYDWARYMDFADARLTA